MAVGDLITLEELKRAYYYPASLTEDKRRDENLSASITTASQAIRKFADRSFGMGTETKTMAYEYDSSGFIDINDAWKVLKVEFVFGGLHTKIEEFYWRAEPQEGPPYYYLTIPHWAGIYSPQMGFRYNLDVIARDRGWPGLIPLVEVEAEFGWPEVPVDVKQAAIYTAAKFAEKPGQFVSERIQDYAYTTQLRGTPAEPNTGTVTALPQEAQDLLAPYVRFQI
jgi:hypothetical protein